MKRFDGYGRVSRRAGRQGAGYISPQVQRDGVQRWAEYAGVEIDQWHFDEDKSGKNQNRPGMREAIRRVEAREVQGIVCLRLNRFARNVVGALDDLKRIKDASGEIVFVEDQIDTSGASGQLMLTVMLAVAEWEHENYSANFREAKARAVARGAYVSRTPWGYGRNDDGTLHPHPERSTIVAETFRRAATESLQAATDYLKRVAPERKWSATKVRRLLGQRSYLGETRNGDLVQLDTHEPLVSRAIWEAAQTTPINRGPRTSFLLSGIAQCATCRSTMIGSRGGKGQRTYRCSGSFASTKSECSRGATITADLFEEYVREEARRLLSAKGLRATISDPETDELTLLERAVLDAEYELDAFASDLTARRTLGDRYHVHLKTRADAVEEARSAYREFAGRARERLMLTTPDIVDDDQLFPIALRGLFESILVLPGRGMTVSERVRLAPFDHDRPARITSLQRVK